MKAPFKTSEIRRYELPGYERRGCVAQEVIGKELIVVKFNQTQTECTFLSELPVTNLEKKLRSCVPRSDIVDTVVVGYQRKKSAILLVDMLMVGGKSVRGKRWEDRLETLKTLHSSFSEEAQERFPLAQSWERGLMKSFDEVKKAGGRGLLLRVPGRPQALICKDK